MPAYLIVTYRITNAEGFKSYTAAVGPTIAAHHGEILVAGPGSEPLEGTPYPITVVVRFPSKQAIKDWYDSPEYQAILPHRLDNTEGAAVIADEFSFPSR